MALVHIPDGVVSAEAVRAAANRDLVRAPAVALLQQSRVHMRGHFELSPTRHSGEYFNPHAILDTPALIWQCAQCLVDLLVEAGNADVIAGPLTGGALLAHSMAGVLDGHSNPGSASKHFAPLHPHGNGYELRKHYRNLVQGKKVWLVDDVLRTGQTLMLCAQAISDAGGTLVGTSVIFERVGRVKLFYVADSGQVAPHRYIQEFTADDYAVAACPMCKSDDPEIRKITRF